MLNFLRHVDKHMRNVKLQSENAGLALRESEGALPYAPEMIN